MSDEDEPQSKRIKRPEWKLVFDHTQAFRTLMEVISNLINRVQIKIHKNDSFSGISIESIDPRRVCLIVAKLACEVQMDDSFEEGVCLETQTVSTCLKSIGSHYSVNIESSDTDHVNMMCYEMVSNSYITKFKLPTLVNDDESVKLNDLKYDYTIEIDLLLVRSIVKNCIALRGEYITFKVQESTNQGRKKYNKLSIISEGNATQEHCFYSVTEREDGHDQCIIKTACDAPVPNHCMDKMDVKYEETFSANYLNLFMKSMERQTVTMRMSKSKPLILNYPLGLDDSNICFVLAPRAPEAE